MKTEATIITCVLFLVAPWLMGCTDAPGECGGEPLDVVKSKITTPYNVIYTDLPRGYRGLTVRLPHGPAIVFVDGNHNQISRDGALSHELACHVLHDVKHPPQSVPRSHGPQ